VSAQGSPAISARRSPPEGDDVEQGVQAFFGGEVEERADLAGRPDHDGAGCLSCFQPAVHALGGPHQRLGVAALDAGEFHMLNGVEGQCLGLDRRSHSGGQHGMDLLDARGRQRFGLLLSSLFGFANVLLT
jgi:hypothetical protein